MYLLKKDLDQSLEIRCDQVATQNLDKNQKVTYLEVILKEFKTSTTNNN